MADRPALTLSSITLDAPDPRELAAFYIRFLGWAIEHDEEDWMKLTSPVGGAALSFQTESAYVRPVWPAGPGDQQMSVHLEFRVEDLDAAADHALACGATLADFQPQDDVRVFLDPAGHPFCLFTNE